MLNRHFQDFLGLLEKPNVEYVIVGGYAVGVHGFPRYTGEMDVFVSISGENAGRLVDVFKLQKTERTEGASRDVHGRRTSGPEASAGDGQAPKAYAATAARRRIHAKADPKKIARSMGQPG